MKLLRIQARGVGRRDAIRLNNDSSRVSFRVHLFFLGKLQAMEYDLRVCETLKAANEMS
jgi:hypothetical protein